MKFRPHALVGLFGSAIINQALLSFASLVTGLIMVRHTADREYGYYVLGWNAILLMTSLQNSFFLQPMVTRLSRMDRSGRGDVVGGLYRAQQSILPAAAAAAALLTVLLWWRGVVDRETGPLILAVIVAALAVLNREYFRMALLAYRRPQDVLRGDSVYVAVLVAGIAVATLTPAPAVAAIAGLSAAAATGALLLSRSLRLHEPWNFRGARGILGEIAPLGAWACVGAAIHWSFSQGYNYLGAGTLGVGAVAAISATRLLMMPINMLSFGLSSLMMPLTASWLNQHGPGPVLRRLGLFAGAVALAAMLYFAVLWVFRDWVFAVLLKKHFAQQDQLLALWFAAFLLMVMRDQLIYLLTVRGRYKLLAGLTLLSAVASLSASYLGMRRYGDSGAPLGVLLGELISVAGIVLLSIRETRHPAPAGAGPAADAPVSHEAEGPY